VTEWVALGLPIQSFYELEDWAIEAAFKGAIERERREWKRVAYGAYHAGIIGRVKKPPRLDEMMARFDEKPKSANMLRWYLEQMGGVTHDR
jgi:hypothetical protein